MEPIQLPKEKDINTAYKDRKEAVLKSFQDIFIVLAVRIKKTGRPYCKEQPQGFVKVLESLSWTSRGKLFW